MKKEHTLPFAARTMVAAAGVYDCESVTSSARDKTHEEMLPVIRPDRSKWGVSPVFRRLHANGGIDMIVGFRFTVFVFQ